MRVPFELQIAIFLLELVHGNDRHAIRIICNPADGISFSNSLIKIYESFLFRHSQYTTR
jgi:hypothetical protein